MTENKMTTPKQTNEQIIAGAEIKAAIEVLEQACKNNKMAYVGFAWGIDPPIIVRFGNVSETGEAFTAMLLRLDEVAAERIASGNVLKNPLTQAN
jgi:hypothetical protein